MGLKRCRRHGIDVSRGRLRESPTPLDNGAGVNARSAEDRTPLMIASLRTQSAPVVKLLLDRGADPNAAARVAAATPLARPVRSAALPIRSHHLAGPPPDNFPAFIAQRDVVCPALFPVGLYLFRAP